jgi:hypothetical protein
MISLFEEHTSRFRKDTLPDAWSYAFRCLKLCFPMAGAMLSNAKSYAFRRQEQCSTLPRVMLLMV